MNDDTTALRYPRLIRRVEAVLLDALVIVLTILVAMNPLAQLDIHGGYKAAMVALAIFALEPGMVSVTGSSIGHHLRGLRVQDARTGAKLGILRAVLRFVVKNLLGWYSLVFMLVTKRHQTVHDMAVQSVVVFKNPESVAEGHALEERETEEEGYVYPSKIRRIAAIIAYGIVALIIGGTPFVMMTSDQCLYYEICNDVDDALHSVFGLLWAVAFAVFLVLGWRGKLWGARKVKRAV